MPPIVVDNPAESRFELRSGDEVIGRAEYRPGGKSVIVAHTEIDEGHEGEGLGSLLIREVLEAIRATGKTVIPNCPFTAAYIQRHPEFIELVEPSLRSQFSDSRGHEHTKRLLIVAGKSAPTVEALPAGVRELVDGADEILVVTPALPNRLDWLSSATDRAREQADQRLGAILDQLAETESDVSGEVGADDPLLAFEDALREFEADHIVIALRPGGESDWQENGLLEQVRERFGLPMTVFEVR